MLTHVPQGPDLIARCTPAQGDVFLCPEVSLLGCAFRGQRLFNPMAQIADLSDVICAFASLRISCFI